MNPPTPLPRAVLWDLDGTIIDTAAQHFAAWQAELGSRGCALSWEAFSARFGQRNDTILRVWLRPDLSDAEVRAISDAKEARYRAALAAGGLAPLPGVLDWLGRLRAAGWRQALATMTPRANVEAIFAALPLGGFFDATVTAEDAQRGKPEPDVFLRAAERLGVPPARCIVVEDAPAGVEAARRAGMRCIGVSAKADLPADRAVQTLAALPEDAFGVLLE